MVYVTHDQVEAMTMADRIVVLRQGSVEQVGAPLELYNRPANRFVAGFIGSPRMNFLDGRIAARGCRRACWSRSRACRRSRCPSTARAAASGDPVTLGVRPEHVRVDGEAANAAEARVEATEQLGSDSYLYCELRAGPEAHDPSPGPDPGPARRAHADRAAARSLPPVSRR